MNVKIHQITGRNSDNVVDTVSIVSQVLAENEIHVISAGVRAILLCRTRNVHYGSYSFSICVQDENLGCGSKFFRNKLNIDEIEDSLREEADNILGISGALLDCVVNYVLW